MEKERERGRWVDNSQEFHISSLPGRQEGSRKWQDTKDSLKVREKR